ncbi:alpha/beta fold hydrolase [Kineosporia sp. J2-2]|uniref:Alpha/beta fold hydrolase n=1 Tax=Kineosporia corallincola TaxID=2835133 RepID=A0ABS5TRG6_9ACTN|nr:alpha/beta hydrolase [Kineosporia corallincola]MBT0773389.1 alpha/beta fold hydrolase [Kineosporia corallincola]
MAAVVAATVGVGATAAGAAPVPRDQRAAASTASSVDAVDVVDAAVDFEPEPIVWGRCADADLTEMGARCAFVKVPLDYGKPRGKTIQLAVSRVRHTAKKSAYQGVVLLNPGGPGASGLGLSTFGAIFEEKVSAAYDWIGFDPRGVGSSRPALSCDGDYFSYDRPPYVPGSRAVEKAWLARARGYAEDCAEAGGELLDHVTTADSARDLEVIRKALGRKKINFIGLSWGSYLGQVYSTMYPHRMRRAVLNGVVNPEKVWYRSNLDQDLAFDRNLGVFFGWVAAHHGTYRLGKTAKAVRKRYYQQVKALDRKAAGGQIGGDEWTDIFLSAGYGTSSWSDLARLFSGWVNNGHWKPLKARFDSTYSQDDGSDNDYANYLATVCTDAPWPRDWAIWRRDNTVMHSRAPFMTWSNAWYNAPCRYWEGRAGTRVDVTGRLSSSMLLINETRDAATPYPGALEVRSRFPKSVLIEVTGGLAHSVDLLNDNDCVDGVVDRYLLTGKLPKRVKGRTSDKQCAALDLPD